MVNDCNVCGRRTWWAEGDMRLCPKGHKNFRGTVPRITLKLGVQIKRPLWRRIIGR